VSKPADGSPRIVTTSGQHVQLEETNLQAGSSVVHVPAMVRWGPDHAGHPR
jgi:hypothetical protein